MGELLKRPETNNNDVANVERIEKEIALKMTFHEQNFFCSYLLSNLLLSEFRRQSEVIESFV